MILIIQPPEIKFLKDLFQNLKSYKKVKLNTINNESFKIYFDNGRIKIGSLCKKDYGYTQLKIVKNRPCKIDCVKLLKTINEIKKDKKYLDYYNSFNTLQNLHSCGNKPSSYLFNWQLAKFYIQFDLKTCDYKIEYKFLADCFREDIN